MSIDASRLPLSVPNLVITGAVVIGVTVAAAYGVWDLAVVMALAGAFGIGSAFYARRSDKASDVTRVNALEFRDERDRQIAVTGLSVLGAAALPIAILLAVAITVVEGEGSFASWMGILQIAVLASIWGLANWITARTH